MYYKSVLYDNQCLQKANNILKRNLSCICESYKLLLSKYVAVLFKNQGKEFPNIQWEFESTDIINGKTLTDTYDNNKIYVIPNESGSFKISIEVTTMFEIDDETNICGITQEELSPPLVDYESDITLNNVEQFESEFSQHNFLDIIDKCIEDAQNIGSTELYINSGGEILYPFNVKEDVKAKLSDHYFTDDEFDDIVDQILEKYKDVEVNEDTNVLCFHFGGDYHEK